MRQVDVCPEHAWHNVKPRNRRFEPFVKTGVNSWPRLLDRIAGGKQFLKFGAARKPNNLKAASKNVPFPGGAKLIQSG
jgi:hypothetical protein